MNLNKKQEISGEKISLKLNLLNTNLAEEIFTLVEKNRDYLSKWLEWVEDINTIDDTIVFLKNTQNSTNLGYLKSYGIFLKNDYIGNISVYDINLRTKSGEIGYWIGEEFSKKGYTSQAVKVLQENLFQVDKFSKLQISCDERNIASAKIAKKCGYNLEGIIKQKRVKKPIRYLKIFWKHNNSNIYQ